MCAQPHISRVGIFRAKLFRTQCCAPKRTDVLCDAQFKTRKPGNKVRHQCPFLSRAVLRKEAIRRTPSSMKTKKPLSFLISTVFVCLSTHFGTAATFTTDSYISATDLTYEQQDIIVNSCTVTIDGSHTFSNLQLLSGGVVTH